MKATMTLGFGLALCAALTACNRTSADEVAALQEDAQALFDTDMAASEALRTQLAERFKSTTDTSAIEKALTADGYACEPDPAAPDERACLKEVEKNPCMEVTIARTKPWRPEKAQVIRVCEKPSVEPPPQKP
jgi:hypothetical protein